MATKNIRLNIRKPGDSGLSYPIVFTEVAADNDYFRIPRRYPFIDIAHYNLLADDGIFRTASKSVSTDYGSNTTNTEGVLGLTLPRTEKLILLVKRSTNEAATLTFSANKRTGQSNLVITLAAGGTTTNFTVASGSAAGDVDLTVMTGAATTIVAGDKFIYDNVTYTFVDAGAGSSSELPALTTTPPFPTGVTATAVPAINVFPLTSSLQEIDLYDMGFFVGGYTGEDGIIIKSSQTSVSLALIARY